MEDRDIWHKQSRLQGECEKLHDKLANAKYGDKFDAAKELLGTVREYLAHVENIDSAGNRMIKKNYDGEPINMLELRLRAYRARAISAVKTHCDEHCFFPLLQRFPDILNTIDLPDYEKYMTQNWHKYGIITMTAGEWCRQQRKQ
jgi:hypothetical protein